MRSLIKETLRAAYTLSPIIILLAVSGMALLKKERETINVSEEREEVIADYRAKNNMHDASCSFFKPVSPTSFLLSL